MKLYRLIDGSMVSLKQLGVLMDVLKDGFVVRQDMPELVKAGVLVEEPWGPLPSTADPLWTEISDAVGHHEPLAVPCPHTDLIGDTNNGRIFCANKTCGIEFINTGGDIVPLASLIAAGVTVVPPHVESRSVFDGTCCKNAQVTRRYRMKRDPKQVKTVGYEWCSCLSCKAYDERECPHESTRSNTFNAHVSCRNCGVEIGV